MQSPTRYRQRPHELRRRSQQIRKTEKHHPRLPGSANFRDNNRCLADSTEPHGVIHPHVITCQRSPSIDSSLIRSDTPNAIVLVDGTASVAHTAVLTTIPPPKEQRDVAGRHYLTKAELNALYFATYQLRKPRGWSEPLSIGTYWRSALVLFFNYGVDTGTIWKSTPIHETILWRHISWDQSSPDGRQKDRSRWGWIFFRRVKTQKSFCRPMNRVVYEHIRNIKPDCP